MEFKDLAASSCSSDDEKYVIYKQDDLFSDSFPLMKEIRRQGKLCDVTLKVNMHCIFFFIFQSPNTTYS